MSNKKNQTTKHCKNSITYEYSIFLWNVFKMYFSNNSSNIAVLHLLGLRKLEINSHHFTSFGHLNSSKICD